jgi:hypothetical protein
MELRRQSGSTGAAWYYETQDNQKVLARQKILLVHGFGLLGQSTQYQKPVWMETLASYCTQ